MDIKAKIEEIVEKVKNDKNIAEKFKKDPIKTVEEQEKKELTLYYVTKKKFQNLMSTSLKSLRTLLFLIKTLNSVISRLTHRTNLRPL